MSRETILTIPKIMCHLFLALLHFLFPMDGVFVLLASNFGMFGLAPLGREWGSTCGYTQGVECLPAPHCGLREYLSFGESSCYWGWVDTLLLWGGEGGGEYCWEKVLIGMPDPLGENTWPLKKRYPSLGMAVKKMHRLSENTDYPFIQL